MSKKISLLPASIAVLGGLFPATAQIAFATVYMSIAEAQRLLFPGKRLEPVPFELSEETAQRIEKASGVRVRERSLQVWRVEGGGVFVVDEVLGKHEFIPYAVGLDATGAVVGVEILEYRETYGDGIRDAAWRKQFSGKLPGDELKFGRDVRNISGATLSCRHISDGVKRLLVTFELALRDV